MPEFLVREDSEIEFQYGAGNGCVPATVPARMRANAFSMSAVQIMGSEDDVGSARVEW